MKSILIILLLLASCSSKQHESLQNNEGIQLTNGKDLVFSSGNSNSRIHSDTIQLLPDSLVKYMDKMEHDTAYQSAVMRFYSTYKLSK